jgi:PAS domain S-box-containing protein
MMRWEARKIRKDGTMLWVRETANAVILKKRLVLLVICEDITEQKRAEEAARRSEKEFRDAIESVPAMVFIALPGPSNVFASQRWLEYTGQTLEDTAGFGWQSVIHPEDLERHIEKWRVPSATGEPFEDEARFRRAADGEYRWFLVRAVALRDQGNILKWYGILTDIEDRKRAEALLTGEKRILEMVAKGDSLAQILDSLCRLVEEQAGDVLASVLLLDGNRLRHGGAPSLPKAYTDAIDGIAIGPSVGSCGTAAHRGEQVIVKDIATDPLWADYRDAALPHSLRACWSTPIFSSQGNVIATFAMYYRRPRSPSPHDQEIIEQITHLAGVAIERKRTQESLRRSEAYLAEAQRLSKTGSWAYNPFTRKTIYWSDEMFRIFELDPREGPSSEKFLQLVHPDDLDRVRERVEREAHEKKEYVDEYRMVLPDGTIIHILDIGHPVFDDAGDVVEFVGTTVDVTERKRAEEALRRSEAYLAEAQRLTRTGSWAYDPVRDKMIHFSEELYRIFGVDPREGTPTIEELWERVHPEDRYRLNEINFKADRERGEHVVDYKLKLPDGMVKYIHSTRHPVLNDAGEIVEILGTTIDVTEQKRAEEELRAAETRFRTYVDHAIDVLFVHDEQGKIVDMNRQACESLGYTREELIGAGPGLFDPGINESSTQRIKEQLEAGDVVTFESTSQRKDGTMFPVEVRIRPFFHGGHRFALSLARDISERKRAEQERERLRQMEEDLARINRVSMMGELTASLAHEIKQPIAAAVSNAEACLHWLARDQPDLAEMSEAAKEMVKEARRAAEIMTRIRSLFKKEEMNREVIDLNEVITDTVFLIRDEADRCSSSVRAKLDAELPRILGDRVQLQQVLLNLMLNGLEAMNSDRGELIIRSQRDEEGRALLSVSDVGVGLPLGEGDKIFDAFFTTKPQGTGMGLAISRSIIESHGGSLWATANAAQGATFYFSLPAVAGTEPRPS